MRAPIHYVVDDVASTGTLCGECRGVHWYTMRYDPAVAMTAAGCTSVTKHQGPADTALHVIGCHVIQETRVQNALNDVALTNFRVCPLEMAQGVG